MSVIGFVKKNNLYGVKTCLQAINEGASAISKHNGIRFLNYR